MKKKIAILISLAMVLTFALAACGGGSSSEDLSDSKYVGTWTTEKLSFAGESEELDDAFTLTLNADGTGTFNGVDEDGNEEVSNLTWSLTGDGFKTQGDAKMTFKDDGDAIVTKILGAELRFVKASEDGEEVVDHIDGAAYGYAGDDPVEAACYQYMVEEIAPQYSEAEISIPTVTIVHEDFTPEDEVLVYGDFWVENYNVEGDTLKNVSGGNHPGCMHVSKSDYTVTAFDQVEDGGNFESSAKEIFGEAYEDFMAVYGDSDARAESRKITVSDYVNLNNLDINYYQDEGWDPVELYHAPADDTAE
ncbi:MAG: hypothetical protein IJI87_12055 [Mogibacterium sp.]|nr:hypothetical protein [Mogibacterium sp.]